METAGIRSGHGVLHDVLKGIIDHKGRVGR